MKVIYKYQISQGTGTAKMQLPEGFKILHVANQDEMITFWAEIDPDAPLVYTSFIIMGTGQPFPVQSMSYVGTAQMQNGLVWHLYQGE